MKITQFGGYTFPLYENEDDIGFQQDTALIDLPGAQGAYDANGTGMFRGAMQITKKFQIIKSTYAGVDTEVDSLLQEAACGRRQITARMRDGTDRVTLGRIVRVSKPMRATESEKHYFHLPVQVTFEVAWPYWQRSEDAGWFLDTGVLLDSGRYLDGHFDSCGVATSPYTFTINNTGNAAIRRGFIEIEGQCTNPKLENLSTGYWVQYTGALGASDKLYVDIGALTALVGATDSWANITMGDTQNGVMEMMVGNNEFKFTAAGTVNCTLRIGWARTYQ